MTPKRRQPTHPGRILLAHFLEPLGVSQAQFVRHLGKNWTTSKLSEIINGRRGITEQTALDFADALGTTPQFWLNLQRNYNLWFAMQDHTEIIPLKEAI